MLSEEPVTLNVMCLVDLMVDLIGFSLVESMIISFTKERKTAGIKSVTLPHDQDLYCTMIDLDHEVGILQ